VESLARFISYLFHPLLIPTYLFILFSQTVPAALDPVQSSSHTLFIILVFIVTFALPVVMLLTLKLFGVLKSFQMKDRSERVIPFTFMTVMYFCTTYLFYSKSRISLDDNFMRIMIVIDLLALVATLITYFFKVSIHSVVIWGALGILIPLNKLTELNLLFYPIIVVVMLAGIIMSARLQLNVHSPREVMWGSAIGLATGFLGMFLMFQY
jgi:hypothetical protein